MVELQHLQHFLLSVVLAVSGKCAHLALSNPSASCQRGEGAHIIHRSLLVISQWKMAEAL